MAFCDVHWFSKILGKQVAMYVLLPDDGTGPYPVYYLLHGLSDDHTIWHRRTRIEQYVRDLPLIVVMPDGFRGFYTNHIEGQPYATYMAEELPTFVERVFPAQRQREGRCIGGLSMGGYGAIRLALGYPDRYVSANSHSGALMLGAATFDGDDAAERRRIFGRRPAGTEHDLEHLARKAQAANLLPRLRIDCGRDDFLFKDNQAFHAILDRMGIAHEYDEFPGAHDWDYWDLHIRQALSFHRAALGI